ncbi:MAG: hypothetical protein WC449_00455 [Candidatus Paceibacterota bacterium]
MFYNYYRTKPYYQCQKLAGSQEVAEGIFLSAFKRQIFINHFWLKKFKDLIKEIFPAIDVSQDVSLLGPKDIAALARFKPFCFSARSFQKVDFLPAAKTFYTFLIDLSRTIEQIEESLDYSVQKQIKKAQGLGAYVERARNFEDFQQYFGLLKNFRDDMGFDTESFDIIKNLWNVMHSDDQKQSCYEVFLCKNSQKEILAAMGIIINPEEKQFIEVASARSAFARTNKLPDNDFLKWEIIKWGHANGFKYYDLAGCNPNALKGSKEYNIYRFKKKWGGILSPYYVYEEYFPENRWYYPIAFALLKVLRKI